MIKLFITGGTIDCDSIDPENNYTFSETKIPHMLEQGRNRVVISSEVLMKKDSLYMNEEDRRAILSACRNCPEDKIIITHGTDTMAETARVLGENIKNKTIVLLGAITPYNQPNSDALFNLGCAIGVVQVIPHGVYVTMNGKVFSWDNVTKNKALGEFQYIS